MMPPIEENVSDAQRLASVTGRGLSPSYVTKARDYPSSTTNHAFPRTHIALEIYLNSGETAAELLGGTGGRQCPRGTGRSLCQNALCGKGFPRHYCRLLFVSNISAPALWREDAAMQGSLLSSEQLHRGRSSTLALSCLCATQGTIIPKHQSLEISRQFWKRGWSLGSNITVGAVTQHTTGKLAFYCTQSTQCKHC